MASAANQTDQWRSSPYEKQEFAFGTDPFDPISHPPRFVLSADGGSLEIQIATGITYGTTNLQTSADLETWSTVPGFPPVAPATFVLQIRRDEPARFFRFHLPGLANSDGDCLSDFEELNLYHTDPTKTDTDAMVWKIVWSCSPIARIPRAATSSGARNTKKLAPA